MIFPPLFGYAEIHYRFRYLITPLFRRRPEIIAEIPHRLPPGQDIPILIVIKDAHRYPIHLKNVECIFNQTVIHRFTLNRSFSDSFRDFIVTIPSSVLKKLDSGPNQADIKIEYVLRGKTYICFNDNYPGTSHKPLQFILTEENLPEIQNYIYGDVHTHTSFTSDQVEFAASLQNTARLSLAMGLRFFCATDHSYDLDDREENPLIKDPALPKWKRFLKETDEWNVRHSDFTIVPGEEVTVRNHREKNIHLLVLNNRIFFSGSGDSGERWFRTRSERSIPQVLTELEPEAMAAAAHPAEKPPFLQKQLIGRGSWSAQDMAAEKLTALQLLNGTDSVDLSLWINALLAGKKIFFAGWQRCPRRLCP